LYYPLFVLSLPCQIKRKQALLGINLSGIYLMSDEKVKRKDYLQR
jgi:hypothetical protein